MARFMMAAAALALVSFPAMARDEKPALDKDFLIKAVPLCHAMTKYAELAEKQSDNADVKAFAKKLINDHNATQEKMAKAAADLKVAVVAGLEKPAKEEADRLSKLKGAEFDRAFLKRIIEDHEAVLKMCEAQVDQGTDAKLKECCKNAEPTIKEHLKEAKALLEKIK